MSYLDHIHACNRRDMSRFQPFFVGRDHVGYVRADHVPAILSHADVFQAADRAIVLHPSLVTFESRSAAVDRVLRELAKAGIMSPWRDEPYAVTAAFNGPALFAMERAGVPLFGVRAYGVHLNGFLRKGHEIFMWVARRSRRKPTFPGMLDNMVAGGLPYGLTPLQCLVKEGDEEAGIPKAWAEQARPVGAITYCAELPEGLRPDVQFCFDLELPPDFRPQCRDGEIEGFMLMPLRDVAAIVRETDQFKFNCNLVIIDFLIRHGLIGPDHRDYVALTQGLHQ